VQHNSDATTHLTIGIDNRIDDRDLIASPWAAVVGSSLHRRCIVVGSLPIVVASLPIVDCRSLIVDR
jgi:hypothetical protein